MKRGLYIAAVAAATLTAGCSTNGESSETVDPFERLETAEFNDGSVIPRAGLGDLPLTTCIAVNLLDQVVGEEGQEPYSIYADSEGSVLGESHIDTRLVVELGSVIQDTMTDEVIEEITGTSSYGEFPLLAAAIDKTSSAAELTEAFSVQTLEFSAMSDEDLVGTIGAQHEDAMTATLDSLRVITDDLNSDHCDYLQS